MNHLYPSDGNAALRSDVPKGKKKSRRKNKKNVVTYALEIETDASPEITEPQQPKPEIPAEVPLVPEKSPPAALPEKPPLVLGEGIETDIPTEQQGAGKASGIVYELAEELYRREKTMTELEALCQPPFHKQFTPAQQDRLDRESEERTGRLLAAAAKAAVKEPVFLPDRESDETEKALSVPEVFLMQLILLLPVVNVIAASVWAFSGRSDRNRRSFGRAFLLWTGIVLTAVLLFVSFRYVQSAFLSPDMNFWDGLGSAFQ